MKWFKHDSDANHDAKLMRVQMKYGMEGYGLYWYCLELIVNGISESKLTFELEHDAEIISHRTGIHYERVQEMMSYMVEQGLFENRNGTITCLKILKRLDKSMTSNAGFRKMLESAKENHDSVMTNPDAVMTVPDLVMQDKTRLDKTRLDNKRGATPLARKRAPKDFNVSDSMYEWADSKLGLSADIVDAQTEAFMDHEFRTARKDWIAVWRNWLRRYADWHAKGRPAATGFGAFDD